MPVRDYLIDQVFHFLPQTTVAEVYARCSKSPQSCLLLDTLFVTAENGKYLGVVPADCLLQAPADMPLAQLLQPVPAVRVDEEEERAAALALEQDLGTVPVVDHEGKLQGAIPPRVLLDILHRAHLEDMNRFVGIWRNNVDQALTAMEGKVWLRAWYRLPWLLVGVGGSIFATWLMADFEQELQAQMAIAYFVPGLVYLADAIGTQSEAIAVRGLSFSQTSLWQLWRGEMYTGLVLGLALSTLVFPIVWWAFNLKLAAVVALALVCAGVAATSVGLLFPWALSRWQLDPAFGSGPVATIVQDVLSLAIYLVMVRWVFG